MNSVKSFEEAYFKLRDELEELKALEPTSDALAKLRREGMEKIRVQLVSNQVDYNKALRERTRVDEVAQRKMQELERTKPIMKAILKKLEKLKKAGRTIEFSSDHWTKIKIKEVGVVEVHSGIQRYSRDSWHRQSYEIQARITFERDYRWVMQKYVVTNGSYTRMAKTTVEKIIEKVVAVISTLEGENQRKSADALRLEELESFAADIGEEVVREQVSGVPPVVRVDMHLPRTKGFAATFDLRNIKQVEGETGKISFSLRVDKMNLPSFWALVELLRHELCEDEMRKKREEEEKEEQ